MKKRTQRIIVIVLQALLLLVLFFPVQLVPLERAGNGLLNVFGMVQWYAGTPFYIIAFMSTLVACILPLALIFAAVRAEEDQVYSIGMICSGLYTVLTIVFYCLARTQGMINGLGVANLMLILVSVASFLLCMAWRRAVYVQTDEASLAKQTI